jgi:endo-1,4-beta-xylanase
MIDLYQKVSWWKSTLFLSILCSENIRLYTDGFEKDESMTNQIKCPNRIKYSGSENHEFRGYINTLIIMVIGLIGLLPIHSFEQPLAQGSDRFLGNVIGNGNAIRPDFFNYWNQVTPEDAGKWASVEGTQDVYNWAPLDNIYNYALSNNFTYKHHALVWGQQYPSWITTLDSANQRTQVEQWIALVGGRYPDMDFVDVVNEPFNAPPPYADALGGSGITGWDWVITAFQWARQYCAPEVKLILNEYNVLHINSITDDYISLIDTLNARGLIDAIGIQGHYFEFKSYQGGTPAYTYPISTLQHNLDRLSATGLPIYITEFDINEADDNIQLENYQIYFPLFWEHPGVKGITLWGYVEYETWKPNAYLIDFRGAERPALPWLRTYLVSPFTPIPISPVSAGNIPRNPVLLWHSSTSAISYHVQVATNSVFSSIVVDTTVTDTMLQLNPLTANTRYYWHVNASNDEGTSRYSTTAIFMTGDQITAIRHSEEIPGEFRLFQNYPNPFNPSTTISFNIPKRSHVRLILINNLGEKVLNFADGIYEPGQHHVELDGSNLSSGIYFCRMEAGNFIFTLKLILMK